MAVYLPGVVAQLNTLGGTAIGTTGNLVLTVVGRGDAVAAPVNLRSVTKVPVPGGGSSLFPTPTLTAGTSVSGNTAATTVTAGETLFINLNGDGVQTISLAANATGAAIAADIQTKVRALVAVVPANQPAFTNFTAAFTTD